MSNVSAAPGDVIYVNGSGGNDSWDGQSAVYNNTTGSGPKLTISNGISTVNTNGAVYIADGTYNEHSMVIARNMNIIGESQNGTIIDAQELNRIFIIYSGTVTLENITFKNGFVGGGHTGQYDPGKFHGGAIYNEGTLNVINCTFTDNHAIFDSAENHGGKGGAIFNYGILNLINSIFNNNIAQYGGAIFNDAYFGVASTNIINSIFTGNQAQNLLILGPGGSGGAIYNFDDPFDVDIENHANINITGSTFTDNWAVIGDGGAICNYGVVGNAIVDIIDSTFTGNEAIGGHGGAIANWHDNAANVIVHMNFNRIVDNIASIGEGIYNEGIVDANNNWWGNNTPNFSQLVNGMPDPDSWLVMNATANPTSIRVGGSSTITVTISSYNNTSGTYGPVGHCAPLSAIFTATLGDMNPASAFIIPNLSIDQLISLFTSTQEGTATINATVDYETAIFSIQANKTLPNITVLNVTGYYGNNVTLTAILKDDQGNPISGETIHFSVNFKYIGEGITDSTGTAAINCPLNFDPDPDPYTIFAILYSNNKYNASIGTGNLTVNINPTTVSVPDVSDYHGSTVSLTATLTDSENKPLSGEIVYFTVNNQSIGSSTTDSTGTATINNYLLNLPPGVYIINATFNGNSNYTYSTGLGTLTVNAIPTNVNVTSVHNFAGQTVTLTADVTDYNGNPVNGGTVTFTIGSTIINSIPVNSGIASWTWTIPLNWNVNIYTITADFDGTGTNYANSTGTGNLTVDATPTNVTVVNVHNFAGQNVTLTANVPDYYGHQVNEGSVRFTVNNSYIDTVSVNNGRATLNWQIPSNWSTGTYPNVIFAEYLGTNNFTASNSYGNITVDPTPTSITIGNFTGINTKTVTLNATLTDVYGHPLTGKTINFKINGNSIGSGTTDNNGIATLNYKLNSAGNFNLTAEFAGDSGYVNSTGNGTLTVDPSSDLYIIITSNKNNPKVSEIITLRYKLGNKGPDDATNVTITIPLPDSFVISEIKGDGTWTINGNIITWTLKNVTVGDPYLYVSGLLNHAGNFVFSSSISSDTYNINTQGVTPVTINAVAEVKAASKKIPMQKTGLPLTWLVLAVMAVFSGLALSKRK